MKQGLPEAIEFKRRCLLCSSRGSNIRCRYKAHDIQPNFSPTSISLPSIQIMPTCIIPPLQTVRTLLFSTLQVIAFASLSSAAVLVPVGSTPTNHGGIVSRSSQAITPQISALAQSLVDQGLVPGLTVGVVQLNGGAVLTEYGLWGNRTEDGDLAQSDVRERPFYRGPR